MNQHKINEQLKCLDIRPTEIRREIYKIFSETKFTLSHAELENITGNNFDRVTIYRTLDLFLEKNLIHMVRDNSGVAKYGLGPGRESNGVIESEHIHFKCAGCGKTFCLDKVKIPQFHFPENIKINALNISAEGICSDCCKS